MEKRLASITKIAPIFAASLRAYRTAIASGKLAEAEAILAWLTGQPNVSAAAKRLAGIKGDVVVSGNSIALKTRGPGDQSEGR